MEAYKKAYKTIGTTATLNWQGSKLNLLYNLILSSPSDTSIKLDWADVSNRIYSIERSTDGTNFIKIGTTETNTYTDLELTTNILYFYRIKATGANYSEIVSRYADKGFPYTLPFTLN